MSMAWANPPSTAWAEGVGEHYSSGEASEDFGRPCALLHAVLRTVSLFIRLPPSHIPAEPFT